MPFSFLCRTRAFSSFILIFVLSFIHIQAGITLGDDSNPLEKIWEAKAVSTIEIQIDEKDWNSLRLQRRDFASGFLDPNSKPFDNFRASISIDGLSLGETDIRKKGFLGSLDDDFPSLRLKLDSSEDSKKIAPNVRLTLNNNKQDPSLLSQYMSYRLFNQAGVPAPRVGFAKVMVNGKDLGVYSIVESVDKVFLKNRFGENSGDLLEGTLADFTTKSIERFDWKSGPSNKASDWRVQKLAEVLASEDLELTKLSQLIDMEEFYRFWAIESMIGAWDGYCSNQNNYFVYHNGQTNKLVFMPWGADSAWMGTAMPFGGFDSRSSTSIYANGLLPHRIYQTTEGADTYHETLRYILKELWKEDALYEEIDRVGELVKPHLHLRQRTAPSSQKSMKRFIQTRRKQVEKELAAEHLTIAQAPRKGMYSRVVGSVEGNFETFWERAPKGSKTLGSIAMTLDNKPESISLVSGEAKKADIGPFGMGGNRATSNNQIDLNGKTESGEVVTLSFNLPAGTVAQGDFSKVVGSIRIGNAQGGFGPFGGPNMKWMRGTCTISEGDSKRGAPIRGNVKFEILEVRGGFFGQ